MTFTSASGAIAAQRLLKGICPFAVMPVLRQVSAGCGIALRVPAEKVQSVRETFQTAHLEGWAFYAVSGTGRDLHCEPLDPDSVPPDI